MPSTIVLQLHDHVNGLASDTAAHNAKIGTGTLMGTPATDTFVLHRNGTNRRRSGSRFKLLLV